MRKIQRRLTALLKRNKLENELANELRYHLERDAEQNLKSGMNPDEAYYAALKSFGNIDLAKEECRDARGVKLVEDLLRDLRHSIRLLVKNPAFSVVAILTLTLGIGANTAIFSLFDAVLLKSLPVPEPETLVLFGKGERNGMSYGFPDASADLFSYPFYQSLRQHNDVFNDIGAQLSMTWTVHGVVGSDEPEPKRLDVQLVSGAYFSTLGITPRLGRLISDDDDRVIGMHPVAVISNALWKQRLSGSANPVGGKIKIDKTEYTIIGVVPQNFTGTILGDAPDVWIPLAMEPQLPPAHWNGRNEKRAQSLYLFGRLKNGVNLQQAAATVGVAFKRFLQDLAGPQPSAENLENMQRALVELSPAGKGINGIRSGFALPLKILMVVVGLVLLISCANIANLMLARAAVRKKEIALRLALGARRLALVRQLLTESLVLAGVAGIAGTGLAYWGSRVLITMASEGPRLIPLDVTPNGRILIFTLAMTVISALIFGATPALSATRLDLNATLKDGKGPLQGNSQTRIGKTLVVAQVALSLMLIVGAGLFVRTLINLQDISTGFNEKNAILFQIDTATTGLKGAQMRNLLFAAEDRVRNIPGVEAAAFSFLTFNQGGWGGPILTFDQTPPQGDATVVRQNSVSDDYFKAMGIPLVSGRTFTRLDTTASQKVVVVSEMMAQRFYPGTSAIGKHFGESQDRRDEYEIIGVVKDVKYQSLTEQPRPLVYYSLAQDPQPVSNFILRVSGNAENVVPAVRSALRDVNANLPIDDVVSLQDHVSRSLVQQKLVARVAAFFGLLALLLASIGLYGVLSYSVARRRNEIGIRMALGASSLDVLQIVLRSGMALTLLGLVIGVGGALALTRLVSTLLFGVTPTDLTTFIMGGATLLIVAFVACYIPARRATHVDPLIALRYD